MNKEFLGVGWSFPPSFDINSRTVDLVREEEDINQSLHILLSTSLGERVMLPDYGCNLKDYQFESVNNSLIGFLKDLVERAILYYEPRIVLEKVDITKGGSVDLLEGVLTISVDYHIEGTNSRYNFVYDFYLRETDQGI